MDPDSPTCSSRLRRRLAFFGCHETPPDADGRFFGAVLPPRQAQLIVNAAWLSAASGAFAWWRGHADLALVPLSVCATSLLYWRAPTLGLRRRIDICVVQLGLWWQLWRAAGADYGGWYVLLTSIGIASFLLGVYCSRVLKSTWASTFLHIGVHVLGNAANVILYSGNVPPRALPWARFGS